MTTTASPSTHPIAATGASHPRGRLPGILVVAGFATFLVAVAVLHVVQHDTDPRHNWVSDYANGRGGWLMTIVFLGAATGLLSLALGITRCVQPSRPTTVAVVAFAIASLGTVASGRVRQRSTTCRRDGRLHDRRRDPRPRRPRQWPRRARRLVRLGAGRPAGPGGLLWWFSDAFAWRQAAT